MMKRWWVLPVLLALAVPCAGARFGEGDEARLLAAFKTVGQSQNPEAAGFIGRFLVNPSVTDADWQTLFRTYFKAEMFREGHGAFWEYAISSTWGQARDRAVVISGYWAADAVSGSLQSDIAANPEAVRSQSAGFQWLARIAERLGPNGRAAVFNELAAAMGDQDLSRLAESPQQYPAYVQYGLTLCEYGADNPANRESVSHIMGFHDAAKRFWESRGAMLFDNGALDGAQLGSLDSLMTAIPGQLHRIAAFVVPESTGVAPATAFATTRQVVFLRAVPMTEMTTPQEFPGGEVQPKAPLFAIEAATSIVRAVETVQFVQRPELRARLDIIISNARDCGDCYLRSAQVVSPGIYMKDPGSLLPSVAFLYFIDTASVFRVAMKRLEAEQRGAMDSFLLLADLLSGGSNATVLYSTGRDGQVTRSQAPLGRVQLTQIRAPAPADGEPPGPLIPVSIPLCNGIGIDEHSYTFDIDPMGITFRVFRR